MQDRNVLHEGSQDIDISSMAKSCVYTAGSAASAPPRPDTKAQVVNPPAAKSKPVQKKQPGKSQPAARAAKAARGPSASGTDAADARAEESKQMADVLKQDPVSRPSAATEFSQGRAGGIAQAEEIACSSDDDDGGQALEEEDSSWSSQQVHALKVHLTQITQIQTGITLHVPAS